MNVDVDAAVVGAGHNGLVTAWYLAKAGLRVHVFERRPFVGGAAVTQELWPGFFFSTCAHAVHGLHPKIVRDMRLYDRGLEVIKRGAGVVVLPDGRYWGPADLDAPRNLTANLTAEEREGDRQYDEFKRQLRAIFAPYRLRVPPRLEEVRRDVAGTTGASVLERALTMSLREVQDLFLPTPLLRDRYAHEGQMIGSYLDRDPLALSMAYWSVDDPESATGQKIPSGWIRGGMGNLTKLMAEAAREAGATIHLDTPVKDLLVEDGSVIGLHLANGGTVRSRLVLSNLDPKTTFLRLLPDGAVAPAFRQRVEGLVTQISSCKFLLALTELPHWKYAEDIDHPSETVALHRTRAAVDASYQDMSAGRPPRTPAINVSTPSQVDPTLAPPGYHTASIWVYPAPFQLQGESWDGARERFAGQLIDQITAYAPNFRSSIKHYHLRTPSDIERENGIADGCIWHVQHTDSQLFWSRPLPELAHYRAPLAGLYLCGAGQHPGGEVTGVPGHNAAQEVLKDLA